MHVRPLLVLLSVLGCLVPGQTTRPVPQINGGGIVIHAGVSAAVTPGSLVDIYGSNLADSAMAAPAGPGLPVTLGGVQVLVNGASAPLIYVSASQIIFQAPYETGLGTASVVVVSDRVASVPAPMTVRQAAPSVLTYGENRAVVMNQDNTVNAAGNGAKPGSVLVAYLIGSGPLDNPISTGTVAPQSPLSRETLTTTVSVGGSRATTQFAGMTPGFVGLAQINFVTPGLAPGDYPLEVAIGGAVSNRPRLTVSGLSGPESLAPLTGTEPRYLAFQIFEGGPDPAIPFDRVMVYTPKEKIAAMARDIVTTIAVTGGERAKLAIILGPISFDHTDAEARQIIDDGFAIALAENVAVGFHIDESMFWSKRADLIGDPANVEWTDFSGRLSTGLKLDWSHPPARMCFNAPKIQAEVTRRARDVIGAQIASHLAILKAQGKENLFAGVIAGWESHMGQDVATEDRVGFHALANRGFGPGRLPSDVGAEVASIVAEFIGRWTDGLAHAGIDPTRIYTHVNFMNKTQFAQFVAAGKVPPNVTYERLVNATPSSQHPSVAFAANSRPGFSTYPTPGVFEQIQEERSLHGNPGWASSEGTNLLPPRSGRQLEHDHGDLSRSVFQPRRNARHRLQLGNRRPRGDQYESIPHRHPGAGGAGDLPQVPLTVILELPAPRIAL